MTHKTFMFIIKIMFIGSKCTTKHFNSLRKRLLQVNAKGEALHELQEPTTCRKLTQQGLKLLNVGFVSQSDGLKVRSADTFKSSSSFLAEMSVRSLRKSRISILEKTSFLDQSVPKNSLLNFINRGTIQVV